MRLSSLMSGRSRSLLVGLLVVGLALSGGVTALSGAALASTETTADEPITVETITTNSSNFTSTGSDELLNETVTATNDTRAVYAQLSLSDTETSDPVNVTVYEVQNGSTTQLDKVQLSTTSGNTELYEYGNLTADTDYRVVIEGNASSTPDGAVSIGTVEEVAGTGGGGLAGLSDAFDGVTPRQVVFGAVILGALVIASRRS